MLVRKMANRIFMLTFLCMLIAASLADAKGEVIYGNGEYIIVDGEDKSSGEEIAFQEAMRNAVQQAGVMIQAYSKSENAQLTDDEVYAVANGIIHLKNKSISWKDNHLVSVHITAEIDTKEISTELSKCQSDYEIVMRYKKAKENYNQLMHEIQDLKNKLEKAKDEYERNNINESIKEKTQRFIAMIWFERALVSYTDDDMENAMSSIETSIALDDVYANAYGLRGMIYEKLSQYDNALQDYDNALNIDSHLIEVYNNKGLLYKQLEMYEKALQNFDSAIHEDCYNTVVYFNRAQVHASMGDFEEALQDYNSAISINDRHYSSYVGRAILYANNIGRPELAMQDANMAISINRSLPDGYAARGMALVYMNQPMEAIDDFNMAISLSGMNNPMLPLLYNVKSALEKEVSMKK